MTHLLPQALLQAALLGTILLAGLSARLGAQNQERVGKGEPKIKKTDALVTFHVIGMQKTKSGAV